MSKWEEVKDEGTKYVDKSFPADRQSLIEDWNEAEVQEYVEDWSKYTWIRASEIEGLNDKVEGKLQIFKDKIEPGDIKQGGLGDCYFLSVLSVLSEHPDRIMKLFLNTEVNSEAIYGIEVTKNGKIAQVVIDDFLPCGNGEPCFSSANSNELWVLILEKVWAKLHGSYERIVGGQSHETFRDITGAPGYEVMTTREDIWEMIDKADKKDYIMAAGVSQDSEEEAEKLKALGLVGQHSYGLLRTAEATA